MHKIISFYKYCPLESLPALRQELHDVCMDLGILGRILVGEEGINGAVCGNEKDIASFQKSLVAYTSFSDVTFREQIVEKQSYHKLVVRVRKEIVAFGKAVDVTQPAMHLSPQQLKEWYDIKKDFVIIDARNAHEALIGKFRDAVILPIKTFKEFPKAIEKFENLKDKEIVMYCTGGIRCEKASAYMKEQGFSLVYQLEGGIINYVNQYPETYYEGACFVFDDRLSSYIDDPISSCALCREACAEYTNCFNLDCDALFVCCSSCREKMQNTCSEECMGAPRQRKVQEAKEKLSVLGVVENYYPQAKVALVRVEKEVKKHSLVRFSGATTSAVEQEITELRNDDGSALDVAYPGMLVTFPVHTKIREHDMMLLVEK